MVRGRKTDAAGRRGGPGAQATRRGAPSPGSGAVVVLIALAGLLAPACGLKTDPRPLSEVIPPTEGLRAWQREEAATVSWLLPGKEQERQYGALQGFTVLLQPAHRLCEGCPALPREEVEVTADDAALVREGARVYLRLPWPAEAARLRVRVVTAFASGANAPGTPVVLERAGRIPTPRLEWRWATAEGVGRARTVQLHWEPPLERIVQVVQPSGRPEPLEEFHRANLYRRVSGAAWPQAPLNGSPITARQYIVPPLQAGFPPGTTHEEFALRYVDRFGNEGAPSAPVRIPIITRRP